MNDWKEYRMEELFVFEKGRRLTKADIIPGNINFLGAISENNGVREKIKVDKYRFGYGRKWTVEKMKETIIKLPVRPDGMPDFLYMENYIKSLPYSDRI